MHVIPVMDVKGGVVVSARAGERETYRPIETPLATSCDPVDVGRGLLGLHPFDTIYVADLDAIEGRGVDHDLLDRLSAALPGVMIWIDCGVGSIAAASQLLAKRDVCAVVGSESVRSIKAVEAMFKLASRHSVLSLDLDNEGFRGPYELLTSPDVWPRSVIAMSIARVGLNKGPALEYVRDVRKLAGSERRVYAAGGIRDVGDCEAARVAGADGVLISTALHNEKIKADDLSKIAGL